MFMVCWHYCVPFLNFLLYAIGPLLFMAGAFVLKRGFVRYNRVLRKRAFYIWLLAVAKIVFMDFRILAAKIFCNEMGCGASATMLIDIAAIVLMAVGYYIWHRYYKIWVHGPSPLIAGRASITQLRYWLRWSIGAVSIFVFWVIGPFISSLIFGSIPKIFLLLSWHYFSILACVTLFMAFWKLEDVQQFYTSTKSKIPDKKDVWVPKDTLWTLLFVYGFTAMMSFASSGVIKEAAAIVR